MLVSFARAQVRGLTAVYEDEEVLDAVDEMVESETYRFSPLTARGAVAGKFVMRSEDGSYESMIPWSQPSVKNPLYAMGMLAPLLL